MSGRRFALKPDDPEFSFLAKAMSARNRRQLVDEVIIPELLRRIEAAANRRLPRRFPLDVQLGGSRDDYYVGLGRTIRF